MNVIADPSPTISVVIPVYNCAPYLERCVRSVLDHQDISVEVILVDDGSTDSSGELCDRMASENPRVKALHQPNSGPSAARNAGIGAATGQYLSFVDGDDALLPGALQGLLGMIGDCGAPLAFGGFVRGVEMPEGSPNINEGEGCKATVYPWEEITEKALYQRVLVNTAWGALYDRRAIFDGPAGVRFREGTIYEDLDFFYRAFKRAGRVAYTPAPVYFYRVNPRSLTQRWSPKRLDVLDVTDRLVEFMAGQTPRLLEAAEDRRFAACCNMLGLLEKNRSALPAEWCQEAHRARARCLEVVRGRRLRELLNPRVRLKNRLAALCAYLPRPLLLAALRLAARR